MSGATNLLHRREGRKQSCQPFRPWHQPTASVLSLAELEQYLAKAADLLRGSIDQADFKAYIFPLMFFKRISDVYLEEFAAGAGGVRRRPRVRGLRREPPLRHP